MDNFLRGGISELEQAKAAILDYDRKCAVKQEAEKAYKEKNHELELKKRAMRDKTNSMIKSRRNELERAYGERVQEASHDLKNAHRSRRDAKNAAISSRISKETEQLIKENKRLTHQNSEILKREHLPAFCNTSLYFALYLPKTVKDFVIFVAAIIVAIALIPNIVCLLLNTSLFVKIVIYILIVLVFVGIYFLVFLWTKKGSKKASLAKLQPNRNQIRKNMIEIQRLEKDIRSETDESGYRLSEYDTEIKRCEHILDEATEEKAGALKEFDDYTSVSIKNEIENEFLEPIEQLERELSSLRTDFQAKQLAARDAENYISSEYAIYLGSKYTNVENIDELINIINEGSAQDIMQALEVMKAK